MDERDVIVIGGGTAGFLAAQTASQLGGKVMLVEMEKIGGICPNWGCIPMCFMEHCIEVLKTAKEAGKDGINTGKVTLDFAKLMSEKDKVVARLTLLTALAPYQVLEQDIQAFRSIYPGDDKLLAATSWASFAAARRIGHWLFNP